MYMVAVTLGVFLKSNLFAYPRKEMLLFSLAPRRTESQTT